jgi:cytochrome oxidase Cu insertion factor (SCO1/SenC/PrrC family)
MAGHGSDSSTKFTIGVWQSSLWVSVAFTLRGKAAPESVAFQHAVEALYTASYTAHFMFRAKAGEAPKVMPLEGLWTMGGKQGLSFLQEVVAGRAGRADSNRDKWPVAKFAEGKAAQILQVGPYADEARSLLAVHQAIADGRFHARGHHPIEQRYPHPMRMVRFVMAVSLTFTLAACSGVSSGSIANMNVSAAKQAPNGRGTEFDMPLRNSAGVVPLVNQLGVQTSLGALNGKYVVIAPFLTICQEVCPMVSANFGRISLAVLKAGLDKKIALIGLTVDPQTDTPTRLRAYQNIFGARSNWSFYTGKATDVSKVFGALGVAFEKRMLTAAEIKAGAEDWLTGKVVDHDVTHQDLVVIIGPDGHEKWLEQGIANTEGTAIPEPLNKYLSSDGRKNLYSPDPMDSWTNNDVLHELSKLGGFKFS